MVHIKDLDKYMGLTYNFLADPVTRNNHNNEKF